MNLKKNSAKLCFYMKKEADFSPRYVLSLKAGAVIQQMKCKGLERKWLWKNRRDNPGFALSIFLNIIERVICQVSYLVKCIDVLPGKTEERCGPEFVLSACAVLYMTERSARSTDSEQDGCRRRLWEQCLQSVQDSGHCVKLDHFTRLNDLYIL
jgi:hypothetical protein